MDNVLLLATGVLIAGLLALVHYTLQWRKMSEIRYRLNCQSLDLQNSQAKVRVIEERLLKYVNSLGQKHHSTIMKCRDWLIQVEECLKDLEGVVSYENAKVIESALDMLEDRPVALVGRWFDSSANQVQKYEELRGWYKKIDYSLQLLGEEILTLSLGYNEIQPRRRNRKSTILNLKAAGINVPNP